jgi:uncharacterized protein YabE (DUF348 family)
VRKIIPAVAAGATALAIAGGTLAYSAIDHKDVTLSVDGTATDVDTRATTVGDVLEDQGITVGEHDVVAPAVSTAVSDGTRIAVQYGRQVTVKVDGQPKTLWTTATRVDQALAALDVNTTGAALSTSRNATIARSGLALDVATLKTVMVDAAGQRKQLRTTAQTAGEVLKAARVTVDANDKLNVRPTTKVRNGSRLTYTRVDVRKVAKTRDISFNTVTKRTSSLKKGVTRVNTSGKTGARTLTYQEVTHNGKVVSRKQLASRVSETPRTKVVLVGTKVAVKKKAQSAKRSSSSRSGSSSAPSGGVWDRIAKCESGGNWSINTGNGFYGGLQFTRSTWRAYGGSGMPHHASRSRQIAVAKKIQAGQGWGAWPGCTSKLGIG